MVVDWKEHTALCIKSNTIIPIFHASALEQRLQLTFITKRLLEDGMGYSEIKEWFNNVECSKTIVNVPELVLNAKKIPWPRHKDCRVWITDKEIKHINDLPYDREFKIFVVAMVYVAKLMKIKKGCAAFNTRDRSYAYYLATGEDNYNVGKQRRVFINKNIRQAVRDKEITFTPVTTRIKRKHSNYYTKTVVNIVLSADWIQWDAKKGSVVVNPEVELPKMCKKCIKDTRDVCPMCGKKYVRATKSKTDLCPECYKAKRRAYKTQCDINRYHKKTSMESDKN